jgi:vacuolar-type H+-ATPase subunit E/Vma4
VTKNEQRIRVLTSQRDIIEKALNQTRERLRKFRKTPEYEKVLCALIKQGMEILAEPELTAFVAKDDFDLAEKCIRAINSQTCKVTVSKDEPLPEAMIGGAVLANASTTIRCDNSFEGRLQLASEGQLPAIGKFLKPE